jgi:hypothetical protein
MAARRLRRADDERGQVLIIVAFAFVAIIMLLALVFDGARGLVMRRELQNTSDAAALAAANIIQSLSPRGCSATAGPPAGAPQAAVVAAAKASVAANMPGYPPDDVVVTCPSGWDDLDNYAVRVTLSDMSPTFFGSIFGTGGLDVIAKGTAVNGQTTVPAYSVILLDPSHLTWPNGRRGCPAFLLSGGPTVTFDSSLYVNSACPETNGGALSTNGNAASLTMGASGAIRLVGEYAPGALTISPAPLEYQLERQDPLATLTAPSTTGMTVRRTVAQGKLIQNGGAITLEPGVYNGGIELRSSAKAYLRPGIYVIQGGGLEVGAQAELYSIRASATSTTSATWATDCPNASCGVLIYNSGTASGSTAMGQVRVAAGAVVKVRAYNPDADTSAQKNETYRNLLIWQDASPVPTSTYGQPELQLTGGGGVDIGGTVYAPSANVRMGGSSGGSGGDSIELTLQFISWSIELYGNSSFHFRYNENEFAKPLDYGLVE